VRQLVVDSEIYLLGEHVLWHLLTHVDCQAQLITTVHINDLRGRSVYARDPFHRAQLFLQSLDALSAETVLTKVKRSQIRKSEEQLQNETNRLFTQAIINQGDDENLVAAE